MPNAAPEVDFIVQRAADAEIVIGAQVAVAAEAPARDTLPAGIGAGGDRQEQVGALDAGRRQRPVVPRECGGKGQAGLFGTDLENRSISGR